MSGQDQAFVRRELVPQRAAPLIATGIIGFLRSRLFGGPLNTVLTILSAIALWIVLVPTVRFLLIDAVWTGSGRDSCLATTASGSVGACWPFVIAKFSQFMYGFYPEAQRWRVDLALAIGVALLIPLLIPRAPAKALNAGLFFLAFPVIAFFLLHGGGLRGFGVSWLASFGQFIANSLVIMGMAFQSLGGSFGYAPLRAALNALGLAITFTGYGLALVFFPLVKLRVWLAGLPSPFWGDFALTGVAVTALIAALNGGLRNGWRPLLRPVATFVGMAVVFAAMEIDRGGLPVVDTRQWGGLLVTMVVSVTGIVASMPVGIALALGRRSTLPLVRVAAIAFIEFWRGVPLITVLFFATYMLPLFLPDYMTVDGLLRVLIGVSLFSGAYNAEVIRGGLQAIPRGQYEAASAMGLSYWKSTRFIILPQALRHVIPGLVNSFIALFKDTTLVLIVAILDLLGQLRAAFADPNWATPTTLFTGFAFAGIIYFVCCFGMSRYSLFVERRLNVFRGA
ncbi:MAG: amino acid ABC transporter permease [Xanthobacteraceae bacterium]|nr:MAG: amino acid ABC transporter permease [Xanthobacteraceae bacterium]